MTIISENTCVISIIAIARLENNSMWRNLSQTSQYSFHLQFTHLLSVYIIIAKVIRLLYVVRNVLLSDTLYFWYRKS